MAYTTNNWIKGKIIQTKEPDSTLPYPTTIMCEVEVTSFEANGAEIVDSNAKFQLTIWMPWSEAIRISEE